MTLMRYEIDKRTNAGLTSLDILTFAHGLAGTPDSVFIRYVATIVTAANHFNIQAVYDATNVTLQNVGDAASPVFEACTLRFHSLIQ